MDYYSMEAAALSAIGEVRVRYVSGGFLLIQLPFGLAT